MKRRTAKRQVISSSDSDSTDTEVGATPAAGRQVNGVRRTSKRDSSNVENRPLELMDLPSDDSSADDLDSIDSDHLFNPEKDRRPNPTQTRSNQAGVSQSQSVSPSKRQVNGARGRGPVSASQPAGSSSKNKNVQFASKVVSSQSTTALSNSSQAKNTKSGTSKPKGGKDVRKKYSELIESCQGYEEQDGFDSNLQKMITSNIKTGEELFHEIGGGPGDMFIAFLHTRMCSGMIKYKTVNIGSNTSAFKVDLFLESLMEKCVSPQGDYMSKQAVKCISSSATDCCKTLPHLIALVGSFNRAGLGVAKEKKARGAPRKKTFDDSLSQATQHEEVKYDETERTNRSKTNAESFSKEILKVLKKYNAPSPTTPTNLFEFTLDKTSFASTIESFFYVAFLIRDGDVCLYRQQPASRNGGKTDATLSIKADKPPEKDFLKDRERQKTKKDHLARRQFILSFSPKKWKALAAIASGEDVISEHKRRVMGSTTTSAK